MAEAARFLYGEVPGPLGGVLHVAATGPGMEVLRIRPETPVSAWDRFALSFARARAQAIVLTGKILREEPELRCALRGPGLLPEGLARWRRAAGLPDPPLLLVLSRGRGLDRSHPAFRSWARPVIFTGREAAAAMSPPAGVAVVGVGEPSLPAALRWLADRGCPGISVEAGPSTAGALYEVGLVDELMLTIYEGAIDPALRAGALPAPARLEVLLPRSSPGRRVEEPSGTWRFIRRWRPAAS